MSNSSNRIISNVIWKFAERILAQLVSLIVSIVLARILLPDDYGAVTMVTVFITVANVFVSNGIPTALIQKKDADQLDFSSCFYFNLLFSIIIYICLFISAPYIASFYNLEILGPVVRVMGLRVIVASVNSVQHSYVSRHMMFKKYFWSTLFGTLVSGVVGIWMALEGYGVWALVAQYMTNTTIDTIVLFVTVNWRPKLQFSISRVGSLFKFGWKILFEGLSNTIVGELQKLIIGKQYTQSDLAYYEKGQQFPALIVNNITASIGSVLFPAMSDEQDNKDNILVILRKAVKTSSYVVYPMLTGLAVVAMPFVTVVLTDKWIETVPYLQALCFITAPTVGMIPRHQALNSIGRSDVFMYEHIISRIVSILVLIYTYKISVFAIVLGSVVSTIILSFIIAFTSKKYNGYSYKDQVKDILPTIIGCVVMGVPVYFMQYLNLPMLVILILQVLVGISIYVIYSYVFHLEEFDICKKYFNVLKSKFAKK